MSLEASSDAVEGRLVEGASSVAGRAAGASYAEHARSRRRRVLRRQLLRGAIGIVVVIALWQWMSNAYDLELILPTPQTVFENAIQTLLLQREKWLYGAGIYEHLQASFVRALVGFGLGAVVALPLGLLVGRITAVREFVGPVIGAFYPIPGIAWIPLAILWFGLSDEAIVFTVFMAAVFPLYFNTVSGARHINPLLVDAGRCFGARGATLFVRVILPATLPFIIVGLRVSLGNAWRMIVAAEILAAQTGIGYVLNEARFLFRAADLMMAMVLISVIGYVTEKVIVGTLERRTIEKWEVSAA